MHTHAKELASAARFPSWTFASAIVLTAAAIGTLVVGYRRCLAIVDGFETRALVLERACGTITWLDEVLTLSASMAAATGEPAWEEHYHAHLELLNEALATARRLAVVAEFEDSTAITASNAQLVGIELRCFDRVRAGDREEAGRLLLSPEYRRLKADYAAATKRSLATMQAGLAAQIDAARASSSSNVVVLSAVLPLLALVWWGVLRALRSHVRARRESEARILGYARQLEMTDVELRRAARARGEFLARMSHEIRTPMNGVLGSAELLGETALDLNQAELLATIRTSGAHLLGVIDDVLDVSKIEAGKLTIALSPCNPGAIARDVVRLLGPTAESRGLSLELHVDARGPEHLLADGQRLRQVLLNLAGNALKFTERGGVTVEMSTERGLHGGRCMLAIAVRDTGIGIAPDDLERVFHGFEQAEGSTARRFGGTGLGLTISRELVELMGGELVAESELGRGSTFGMVLDLEPAPDPALPSRCAQAGSELLEIPGARAGARVLLVEDNPVNRAIAERMLGALACQVVIARDGAECLARMAEASFDLVLMDCHMPGVDGFHAARTIREREQAAGGRARTPIVALSASVLPADVEACLAAGMDDFVSKPISRDRLEETVRRWARREETAV
jgi:signal transduction histidine kinase/ActR/RegA family two-component response regulator